MSHDAPRPIDTDFEITMEMLASWEDELDEFQANIRNRLALLSCVNESNPVKQQEIDNDLRQHSDAIQLTESITDLLK